MANSNIVCENARIGFKNFSGKEGQYNPAGKRNFCLFLDDEKLVKKLMDDGWNIRFLKPRDEDEKPAAYLQVSVSYNNYPPKVVMITSRGKTSIAEDEINMLDWAEIKNVDVIIRPYNWSVNGKSGVKAYLKAMYVTIEEDEFESKYEDVPDSAQSSILDDDDVPF